MTDVTDILNSKLLKKLAESPQVIIFLFLVFTCVFATLVLFFGNGSEYNVFALICFIASLPLIVFIGFFGLVILYYIKLSNFKNEENFRISLKTDITNVVSSLIQETIKSNSINFKDDENFRRNLKVDIMNEMCHLIEKTIDCSSKKTMEEIKEILELFSKINLGNK